MTEKTKKQIQEEIAKAKNYVNADEDKDIMVSDVVQLIELSGTEKTDKAIDLAYNAYLYGLYKSGVCEKGEQ